VCPEKERMESDGEDKEEDEEGKSKETTDEDEKAWTTNRPGKRDFTFQNPTR
jgi:hypothetical protein